MNFKLYIGLTTQDNRQLSKSYVITQVSKLFNNFTVIDAIGYYNGIKEKSLIIEIYNYSCELFTDLCNHICKLSKDLNQECIGFLHHDNFKLLFANDYEEYLDEHWLFKSK